jgi:uncharacterized protein
LIAARAEVNGINKFSWDALMLASVGGYTEIAKALLAAGANPKYKSPNGETALILAERGGHAELAALLRKAGAK